jgi:hypothetical protein
VFEDSLGPLMEAREEGESLTDWLDRLNALHPIPRGSAI